MSRTVLIRIVGFGQVFLLWLDGPDRTLVAHVLNAFLRLILSLRVVYVV